jgi:hypothetical protein
VGDLSSIDEEVLASGCPVRDKLVRWRDERRPTLRGVFTPEGGEVVCAGCSSLIKDLDAREVALNDMFTTLWNKIESKSQSGDLEVAAEERTTGPSTQENKKDDPLVKRSRRSRKDSPQEVQKDLPSSDNLDSSVDVSSFVTRSLGKLGLDYVEKRFDLRGAYPWFSKRVHECRLCPAKFNGRIPQLFHHLEEAHGGEKSPFVCHMCLAGFDVFWEYAAHVMYEELATSWICPVCQLECGNPRRLEAHFASVHASGDSSRTKTPFTCYECSTGETKVGFLTFEEYVEHRHRPDVGAHKPARPSIR